MKWWSLSDMHCQGIGEMLSMAYLQACCRFGSYRVGLGLLLVVACALPLFGQTGRGGYVSQLNSPQSSAERESGYTVQPVFDGNLQAAPGQPSQGEPRYEEPPPPDFDPWTPTWAPCQSLRTNRSLVLGHLYWGADILGWATKGVHAPPLVTSSASGDAGIIGQSDTVIRFGNEFQHSNMRPGGRLTIGWWFDPNQYSGIEWHYFELDGQDIDWSAAASGGNSFLGRPIINAVTGANDAIPVADATLSGSIRIRSNLQLTSTGILFRDL